MLILSLFVIFIAVGQVIRSRPNIANAIGDFLAGGLDLSVVVAQDVARFAMRFAVLVFIVCLGNAALFTISYLIGFLSPTVGNWFWTAALLFALVQAFTAMIVLYLVRLSLGAAGRRLQNLGCRISGAVPSVAVPLPQNWLRGWRVLFSPLTFLFCLAVNSLFLPVALIVKGFGGIISIIAATLRVAGNAAYTMARILGYVCLVALTLGSLVSLELLTGLHFLDTVTVLVVVCIVAAIVVLMVMAETLFKGTGVTIASVIMASVSISVFGFVLIAHLDPTIAKGLGRHVAIAHNEAAKWLHWSAAAEEDTEDVYVAATREIKRAYQRTDNGLWRAVNVNIRPGTVGALKNPHVQGETENTRCLMQEIVFDPGDDPDLALVDTRIANGDLDPVYLCKNGSVKYFKTLVAAQAQAGGTTSQTQVSFHQTQTASPQQVAGWEGKINPAIPWQSAGNLQANAGDRIKVTGSGQVNFDPALPAADSTVGLCGANYTANQVSSPNQFPLPTAPIGSLLMRVGNQKYPVCNGEVRVLEGGPIELGLNDRDGFFGDNTGQFNVQVAVLR